MTQEEIKSVLRDTNDGPVDRFIMIARACALCAKNPNLTDEVANVLDDEIIEYCGPYASTEFK